MKSMQAICRCNQVATRLKVVAGTSPTIFTRTYAIKPFSKVPKVFLKKKNRNKANRDDVYFVDDQILPQHQLDDALDVIRAYDLFGGEPIDVLLKLNMGTKKGTIGSLKGLIKFPKPVQPMQKVLVLAEGDAADEAREAGATIVGGEELIPKIENNELDFDHCLSTLDFLPKIKHLPKILRNKMPNKRNGSATDDIPAALDKFVYGESYVADKKGRLRHTVGLTSFTNEEIRDNLRELLLRVDSHKTTPRDKYFISAGLAIPPGPKLDVLVQDALS